MKFIQKEVSRDFLSGGEFWVAHEAGARIFQCGIREARNG
jgi:hypothetical protein